MAFNSGKYKNGRSMIRDVKGRFTKPTLSNMFGIQPNTEPLVCGKCGYGSDGGWFPVLPTGYCPKCGNQEGNYPYEKKN